MNISLQITTQENDIGFVENKRSFAVEGDIIADGSIPDNASLRVELYDKDNKIVRYVHSNIKNQSLYLNHPELLAYKEELDRNRVKLNKFGFPLLVVNDINNPNESFNNGSIKCWFSDTKFKAIIINASNKANGALFDDGFNFVDENGKSYELLKIGFYKIVVTLSINDNIICTTYKNIEIGKRSKQLICRFNPVNHKLRIKSWCEENGISIINDLMPGYLDPYLGNWYYHMGFLKMYRANDLCLFEDTDVVLFDYLIDETSTSYASELAYLQSENKMNRVSTYYYDIGEASINEKSGNILKFSDEEYGKIYRIDILNNKDCENVYYLNLKNVKENITDLKNITIKANEYIAIAGVIKPIQLNPNDFILNDDNTYKILDYPDIIKYTFNINGNKKTYLRKANMERIENSSIGKSVYEFYNVFSVDNAYTNCTVKVKVECIYAKGLIMPIDEIEIKVVR